MKADISRHVGKSFGRLTVVGTPYLKQSGSRMRYVAACRCSCGTEKLVRLEDLCSGNTQSCGCLASELHRARLISHGLTNTPEYNAWLNMQHRCYLPSHATYKFYGGRKPTPVTVCDRWKDVSLFITDMGPRPSDQHSLDRIDNLGNYEPSNCKWSTIREQHRNTKQNRFITFAGKTMCALDWANELKISFGTITERMDRGLPTAVVLSQTSLVTGKPLALPKNSRQTICRL